MVQCAGSHKIFARRKTILAGLHNLTTSPPHHSANPVCRICVWSELYQALFEARAGAACAWRNLAKNTRLPLLTSLLGLQLLAPHHHPTSEYAELHFGSIAAQRYPEHAPQM